jgi:two-component system response regulator YesN
MRVVIADDEEMARFMIRSQIAEVAADLDCRIVAEAKNGEELLDAVRVARPDLVIADIRMPSLDGLEALKVSKDEGTEAEWIMLTGFSDFQYAREALRGGACEYLLKPVPPEELRSTLERASRRLRARKIEKRRKIAEGLALRYLSGDQRGPMPADEELRLRLFLFDSIEGASAAAASDLLRAALEDRIGRPSCAPYPCGAGKLICVSAETDEPITLDAARAAASVPLGRISVTVISERIASGCDLSAALEALMESAPLRAVHGLGREYSGRELVSMDQGVVGFCRRLDSWADALRSLDFDAAFRLVDEVESADAELRLSEAASRRVASFIAARTGFPAVAASPSTPTIRMFGAPLRAATEHRRAEREGSGDLVEATVAYVEANYMRSIGLAVIADSLDVSANYLSGVFHKRMGVRFSHYLTRYRISQARRRLVLEPREPVAVLAREVGFPNARYFAKRFILHVGVTPSEYRSRALSEGGDEEPQTTAT